jgi:hypothetical protein
MNFDQLRRRVERAERLVQGRADDTQVHWHTLRRVWREGWTAPRIVIAGIIAGFVAGKLEPAKGRAMAGQATRWVQMFSTVSGLFSAMQAQAASDDAERAGDEAERAADHAEVAATGPVAAAPQAAPRPASRAAVEEEIRAPRPAEAATEISER